VDRIDNIENEWLKLWKECTKLAAEFVRKEKNIVNGMLRVYYKEQI